MASHDGTKAKQRPELRALFWVKDVLMKHNSKHRRFAFWLLLSLTGWSGHHSSADSYGPSRDFELLQRRVAFSPDKTLIAMTGEDGVELWDTRSKQKQRTVMQSSVVGNRAVNALAFSPDNRLIACGRPNATALLWDVATGRWTQPLGRYDGLVTALDFSPNGRVLAGGSYTSIDVTPESEKPKVGEYRRFPPSFYRRYKNTSEVTRCSNKRSKMDSSVERCRVGVFNLFP